MLGLGLGLGLGVKGRARARARVRVSGASHRQTEICPRRDWVEKGRGRLGPWASHLREKKGEGMVTYDAAIDKAYTTQRGFYRR